MRRRSPTLLATVVLLLALVPAAAAQACPDAGLRASPATVARQARATLCLVNAKRIPRGLPALRPDARLARAGREHAADMVLRGFFAHTTPGGTTLAQRIRQSGYLRDARAWAIGENIAWGAGSASTPAAVVRGWMRSPGHRAVILNARFRELGIGIVMGSPSGMGGAVTVAAEFGRSSQHGLLLR